MGSRLQFEKEIADYEAKHTATYDTRTVFKK